MVKIFCLPLVGVVRFVLNLTRVNLMSAQVHLPSPLKAGDAIGVCAPSGAFEPVLLEAGIAQLRKMGFFVHLPPGLNEVSGYLAGNDRHRAALVNDLFKSTEIKAVFCARGGFGALRVLPFLDFTLLKNSPKLLIGFSDITAILSQGIEQCTSPMIHGPVITSLAGASVRTLESLFQIMTEPFSQIVIRGRQTLSRGSASGILKGGNLATLVSMVGTPFQPDFEGSILFLEDTAEPAYKIDRMLTQLRLSGLLTGVKGVVLGSFDRCGDIADIHGIVAEVFNNYPVPILAGVDAGHGEPNLCIPLGSKAILDADGQTLGVRIGDN